MLDWFLEWNHLVAVQRECFKELEQGMFFLLITQSLCLNQTPHKVKMKATLEGIEGVLEEVWLL